MKLQCRESLPHCDVGLFWSGILLAMGQNSKSVGFACRDTPGLSHKLPEASNEVGGVLSDNSSAELSLAGACEAISNKKNSRRAVPFWRIEGSIQDEDDDCYCTVAGRNSPSKGRQPGKISNAISIEHSLPRRREGG
jgi:hypothetical protein